MKIQIIILIFSFLSLNFLNAQSTDTNTSQDPYAGFWENASPSSGNFTDIRNNNTYKYISLNGYLWMVENLNVDKFRNGDPIPEAKTDEEWKKAGEDGKPAWCYYNNNPDNGDRYGKLYNWYAVNDPRALAPEGWKIPDNDLWSFIFGLDVYNNTGTSMKSKEANGTNEFGFNGTMSGYRSENGLFSSVNDIVYYWSSSAEDVDQAWCRGLASNLQYQGIIISNKGSGLTVRCCKHE